MPPDKVDDPGKIRRHRLSLWEQYELAHRSRGSGPDDQRGGACIVASHGDPTSFGKPDLPLHKIGISCDQENRDVAVTVADMHPSASPCGSPGSTPGRIYISNSLRPRQLADSASTRPIHNAAEAAASAI